ncbi:alpha/beta hydrolase [Photobacterium damselae subsp. damselae]|uniref:Alpha/beta hydrolase n=1 Tax=Photobacterium damselae subsp. damselae TaxID=85581 RepID=A0A7Y7UF75_PHODD|nr:alpha/beta hydrolase [Photobacterium damselae]NVH51645.1 alpha/beta hydrolase [Photobacterium damselae subsp. damselae]NVO60799.1 alpha/beta hydrolase [Photobacterium damselae subsp. damselae]NVO81189.1 alpha/beta hydrolase [Photobacterium damselae subsp. damselae]NVO99111.1 alpha/beta hydrolase [Photobacterium damselae subsp. damselae]
MTIIKKSVYFISNGSRISAELHQPKHIRNKCSAVVIAAPQAGVKEQTVQIYAEKLAKKGFVALTFDHSSFGASEGFPRFNENPFNKAEDCRNAVTFLRTLEYVDEVHGLGICSGGGYLAHAVASDRRVKSLATVSAYFDHRGFYNEILGREGILALLAQVNEAREHYLMTGEINYLPHAPQYDLPDMPRLFREFYEYYMTDRGIKGLYESKFLPWSYENLVNFSALDIADKLSPTPLLMIVGTEADSAYESEKMFNKANEPKELIRIEGANHIGLYDVDKYVDQAVNQLVKFFKQY